MQETYLISWILQSHSNNSLLNSQNKITRSSLVAQPRFRAKPHNLYPSSQTLIWALQQLRSSSRPLKTPSPLCSSSLPPLNSNNRTCLQTLTWEDNPILISSPLLLKTSISDSNSNSNSKTRHSSTCLTDYHNIKVNSSNSLRGMHLGALCRHLLSLKILSRIRTSSDILIRHFKARIVNNRRGLGMSGQKVADYSISRTWKRATNRDWKLLRQDSMQAITTEGRTYCLKVQISTNSGLQHKVVQLHSQVNQLLI